MKKIILISLIIIITISVIAGVVYFIREYRGKEEARSLEKAQQAKIDELLESRRNMQTEDEEDPFGEDNLVRILFVGLDSRIGQDFGHCDAIQMFEINRANKTIQITAVPRGTYAPLPGTGHLATDYYVSKSCEVGGLEYGIEQIEKILGKKSDYVVMVGFSEALGIFRYLDLPANETLQWLRHRQGYAIGEPQRARNHSNFLRQMLVKYIPNEDQTIDSTWQYLLYKMIKTDLSYNGAKDIIDEIARMNLSEETWRISLAMRPAYEVSDIAYDPEHVTEYLHKMIDPIKHLLSKDDYSDITPEEAQERVINLIEENKNDSEFIPWAFDNDIWLQVDDEDLRDKYQFELTLEYVSTLETKEEREALLADYILEMDYLNKEDWKEKGKQELEKIITE